MKSKEEINNEAKEIYLAIIEAMKFSHSDYCQSWWINKRNVVLKSKLETPQINQRCKLLVKKGFLIIDKSKTSRSTGTSYKLTDKLVLDF
jgi:hypothetical protein